MKTTKIRLLENGGVVNAPEPRADEIPQQAFPEGIDPNDVFFDEEDNIISYFDREKNETINYENGKPVDKAPATEVPPKDTTQKDEVPATDQSAEPGDEEEKQENKEDEVYHNAAHYVMKRYGYSLDEIEMEDGTKKPLADLTESEQLNLLASEFDNIKEYYETQISELKLAPSTDFQNEDEKEIITFLRNGGNPLDLANKILESTPGSGKLSDDDLVKQSIKDVYDSFTDEEVDEEIASMSEDQIKKKAAILREKMAKQDPSLANLTKEQLAEKQAQEQREVEEFQAQVNEIKDYVTKIEDIAGIKVTPEIKEYLLKEITATSASEDSNFIKSLSTPEKLARLQFLDSYAEDLLKETAKKHFELGQAEGKKTIRKFSSTPYTAKSSSGQSNGKKPAKKPVSIDSEKFYEVEKF